MAPTFTLSMNTAAAPGAVFVHHNRKPMIVARLLVFPTHNAACEWANGKDQKGGDGIFAVRGQFALTVEAPEPSALTTPTVRLAALIRRMIDWYVMNGIHDDPNTDSYPRPHRHDFQ